jgi:PIN domain nuclease of toxin-antitoxin system
MKVLLDTHALIWIVTDDDRLSETARSIFLDPQNSLFFSIASLWEICIKISLEKIALKTGWLQTIQKEMKINTILWLPIETEHCAKVVALPFHHRDPFDRLLVAQTMVEDLRLLSRDSQLSAYNIKRIW